jgi:hypothetical protein
VAAFHVTNNVHTVLRKSTRDIHASKTIVYNRRASAVEPLLGAPHGLGRVLTILIAELLVRHPLFPLIRLHKDYAARVTVRSGVLFATTIGWLPSHKHPTRHGSIAPIFPSFALP